MELVVCKDVAEAAHYADRWVERQVLTGLLRRLYVPAGATPEALYALWRETKPDYLQGLKFIQIDDVLTGPKAGCFRQFFEKELAPWLQQMSWLKDGAELGDAAILGLGLNGHVAFHEPGLPKSFFSGCVSLSPVTCERLQLAPGTWGVSYGLGAFLRCREILMLATGASKREIVQQLLERRGEFPALALRDHAHFTLVIDQAAQG
ncbi:MAG: 6-phosphogluconolactonase [Bdellovibrionales bacterium]